MQRINKIFIIVVVLAVTVVLGVNPVNAEENLIPSWVKGIASFWVEDGISDSEFKEAIAFLLENEIIVIEGYGKISSVIEIPKQETSNIKSSEVEGIKFTFDIDKNSYKEYETIFITGTVPFNGKNNVMLMVTDSSASGMIVKNWRINATDNEFKTEFTVTSSYYMREGGEHIVRVGYNNEQGETPEVLTKSFIFEASDNPRYMDAFNNLIPVNPIEEKEEEPLTMPELITSDSIKVKTDKSTYSKHDVIRVTGEVAQLLGGYNVSVIIYDIQREMIFGEQVAVTADKEFSTEIIIDEVIGVKGDYTVKVSYGDNKLSRASIIFSID